MTLQFASFVYSTHHGDLRSRTQRPMATPNAAAYQPLSPSLYPLAVNCFYFAEG